jgi:hypothetical protein
MIVAYKGLLTQLSNYWPIDHDKGHSKSWATFLFLAHKILCWHQGQAKHLSIFNVQIMGRKRSSGHLNWSLTLSFVRDPRTGLNQGLNWAHSGHDHINKLALTDSYVCYWVAQMRCCLQKPWFYHHQNHHKLVKVDSYLSYQAHNLQWITYLCRLFVV